MLLRGGRGTPTLIFSEVGHGKTKPSRWLERSPKLRIYIGATACKTLENMKKQEKLTDWGPTATPPPTTPSEDCFPKPKLLLAANRVIYLNNQ